jgi:putative redox protein
MSKVIASAAAQNNGELYSTKIEVNGHSFFADEPVALSGKGTGPTPVDFLCGALASCTVMTLRMYAERKKWKVDEIQVKVNLVKEPEKNTFYCEVKVTGDLTEEQHKRLLEIAKVCPVHKMITRPNDVVMVRTV